MYDTSLVGIIIAAIAVIAAYSIGYANGIARGRDEGYNDGKRDGSQEGSVHGYAAGFDRGKRARDEDDDDDDDEDDEQDDAGGGGLPLGSALVAVAAGFFAILWLSSQTPSTQSPSTQTPSTQTPPDSIPFRGPSAQVPRVAPTDVLDDTHPSQETSPTHSPPPPETVALPRLNRTLPTASPLPPVESHPHLRTPARTEGDAGGFPHPPPAFRQPR